MTIEFQYEQHTEKHHTAIAQLSSEFGHNHIRQVFADMDATNITLRQMFTKSKPHSLSLSTAEADAFVEAWLAFKANTEEWLQIEAEKKARAEQAEQARQLAVWKEVEQLAGSIPGLEIIAREETVWDEDDENGTTTAWTVKHEATSQSDMYNHTVDQVLTCVQETIEYYNRKLADCEEDEKENWKGYHPLYIENSQKFLATHRAFVASKTPPLVDVNA